VQRKIKSIITEDEIKTKNDEVDALSETIARELGAEDTIEIKLESKKIRLEIERLEEENPKEFVNFKKEEFKKKLIDEIKKLNPEIKQEELVNAKEYGEMVAETYFGENIIDGQKDDALNANSHYSPGKLENAWTDLKGTTKFLAKKPKEIKAIQQKYKTVKDGLKNVKLPDNLRESRSFENVISSFSNPSANNLFLKTQKYLGWADRVDKLTGGWLTKTTGKVGGQVTSEFAKNSLGVMADQGFKQGFSSVLKGVVGGGVRAAGTATTAGTAAAGTAAGAAGTAATAAGATAVSATGVGAIVVAAAAIVKVVKGAADKIAEKLGISAKKFLEENFGKAGGAVISGAGFLVGLPVLLIGAISATVMTPIILVVLISLFGYQIFMGDAVASLVPPKGDGDQTYYPTPRPTGGGGGGGGGDFPNATCSVANKVILTSQCDYEYVPMRADGGCSHKNVCSSGCGPTSVSEILQAKNSAWNPEYLMKNSDSPYYNVYSCSGGGTAWSTAISAFKQYLGEGSVGEYVDGCTEDDVKKMLCQHNAVMILLSWKGGGHYIVAVGINSDGQLVIKDPGNGKINLYPSDSYYSNKGKTISSCLAIDASYF
jgi:hypothetical protein